MENGYRDELLERIKAVLLQRERRVGPRDGFRPAAVLIPIFIKDMRYFFLLTKRTSNVEHHKGQISFPGGAYDEGDEDLKATALRESYEEIGLREEDVRILGALDDLPTVSKFMVTPFVASIPYPYPFRPSQIEIEHLIEVPLEDLLEPKNFRQENTIRNGQPYTIYYYSSGSNIIWGHTAKLLKQLLELVFVEGTPS